MKVNLKNAKKTAVIIEKRLSALNVRHAELKNSDNPQVIFLIKELNAERWALDAVLKSLYGDSVILDIFP